MASYPSIHFDSPQDVLEEFKRRGLNEKFCVTPFSTLIVNPDLTVSVCRVKGTEFIVGDLRKQSIEEIWNGEFLQKWRQELLTGNISICEWEQKCKSCNLCTENNTLLPHIDPKVLPENPILKFNPHFNGFCNLKCTFCNIWMEPNGLYDEIGFWEIAKKNIFPHLLEIDLLSGEPLVQKDNFKLMDIMAEVNPECLWTFTTNAHWRINETMINYLEKIRIKNFIISLDSLDPEIYHKIRYPGKLDLVLKNIDKLIEYNKARISRGHGDLNFVLNFLWQRDNWHEVQEIISYCNDRDLKLSIIPLQEPHNHSVLTMQQDQLEDIMKYYLEHMNSDELKASRRVTTSLINEFSPRLKKKYLLSMADRGI